MGCWPGGVGALACPRIAVSKSVDSKSVDRRSRNMLRYASFFNFSSSFLFYTPSEDFHQAASSIPQDRLAHQRDVVALAYYSIELQLTSL